VFFSWLSINLNNVTDEVTHHGHALAMAWAFNEFTAGAKVQ